MTPSAYFYAVKQLSNRYDEWQTTYAAWQAENPDKAKMLQDGIDHKTPTVDELMAAIPEFDQDTDIATRIAGQMVLQVCVCVCQACVCSFFRTLDWYFILAVKWYVAVVSALR